MLIDDLEIKNKLGGSDLLCFNLNLKCVQMPAEKLFYSFITSSESIPSGCDATTDIYVCPKWEVIFVHTSTYEANLKFG